ncbi:MAG: penicillin-binding protein 2 [Candidatus Margulisbacteria bacterium]|nr:penicillin-binding protein 2 [Candidatus Margulisiibacteriota bacterium]MBU1021676.1 penicillin-binding protein 2 [Candidatus Margulisiibacteriota bacterium]MBU1729554.1 penicillin-binding protein 2 [Candidatus Margulisiibacteriota bacterium]MBU1955040.1 penicillin-binding protein 2 [Candidatus Margulisiibacteriota bacterium]
MNKVMRNRMVMVVIMFAVCFLIAAGRLFELQIVHFGFYRDRVEDQRQRVITLASPRGDIYDRNGELLATTVDSYSLFVIPREVASGEVAVNFISNQLDLKKKEVQARLFSNKSFVWLKRKIDDKTAKIILDQNFKGIHALKEKKRIYPKGHLASTVLGFVGMDNQGLAGIELSYDQYLRGEEGQLLTERDPLGREIVVASKKVLAKPSYGMNLKLTLDATIQYIAESELEKAIQKYSAKSGTIIVMNPQNGEILAMATKPDFDPQNYSEYPQNTWKTGAVSNVYEPGSTFKVITVAAGLKEGVIDDKTRLRFLEKILVGGKVIENAHEIDKFGQYITVSEMLQESVNTGSAQIGLLLGEKRFYETIDAFGFGKYTEVGLPGESRGILRHYKRWYKPDIGMITFGQGIAVTPLQLSAAVSALATEGKLMRPQIVSEIESLDGKFLKDFYPEVVGRPVSAQVAKQVTEMMENVVINGTGKQAQIKGFKVAAKTGTSQKAATGRVGYLKDRYISSFIGFAPVSQPALFVLVMIDDPRGAYWGGTVAGPVFHNVMEKTLRYLNIPPDDV